MPTGMPELSYMVILKTQGHAGALKSRVQLNAEVGKNGRFCKLRIGQKPTDHVLNWQKCPVEGIA
jgi:hypothetical protein